MTISPTRRELNKARTRQALLDAVQTLAGTRGLDSVTAEDIAAEAGVSRRTFFNYFAGVEAMLAEGMAAPLDELAEVFLARPPQEPPLRAVIGALHGRPMGTELLSWMATLGSQQGTAVQAQVWHHHEGWLVGLLRQRLGPSADPLAMRTLAAATMAIFEAVERIWLERMAPPVDDASVAEFNSLLLQALEQADAGWRLGSPTPQD